MKYTQDWDIFIGPMFFAAWCGFLFVIKWTMSSSVFDYMWPLIPMGIAAVGMFVFLIIGITWYTASKKQNREFFDCLDRHRERILSGKEEYHDYSREG